MQANGETGHVNSQFHERTQRCALIVKRYGFDNPEFLKIDIILTDVIKECKVVFSHTFEYRCKNDT